MNDLKDLIPLIASVITLVSVGVNFGMTKATVKRLSEDRIDDRREFAEFKRATDADIEDLQKFMNRQIGQQQKGRT